jgi:CDP-glucose 4,6-dehydratase
MSLKTTFEGKKIFLTGHTGFKGSWLNLWLQSLGAEVYGFSLAPDTKPNHHELLELSADQTLGNIQNQEILQDKILSFNPDLVLHLAAQPLVRDSYQFPRETYLTNVLGSLHLYEACRKLKNLKGIVSITTDKVYENDDRPYAFKEDDPLGGKDPYSSSKACMEILSQSYASSYFNELQIPLVTLRAGNVIGGGDWAKDRLIPDIIRCIQSRKTLSIRYPEAIRPWQHVLEPLSAYLQVAARLINGEKVSNAYNIGPTEKATYSVLDVLKIVQETWPDFEFQVETQDRLKEANYLALNCEKIQKELGWKSVLNTKDSIQWTIQWYRQYTEENKILTLSQIQTYEQLAKSQNIVWAK